LQYFFKQKMYIDAAIVNRRTWPQETWPFNNTQYSHGIHADNCQILFDSKLQFAGCRPTQLSDIRHYTAILYLNQVQGADLLFFDFPSGLVDDKGRQLAIRTPVHPVPGKLVLFTSGPENIHAVTKMAEGSAEQRFTFSCWYTNLTSHLNMKGGYWREAERMAHELEMDEMRKQQLKEEAQLRLQKILNQQQQQPQQQQQQQQHQHQPWELAPQQQDQQVVAGEQSSSGRNLAQAKLLERERRRHETNTLAYFSTNAEFV